MFWNRFALQSCHHEPVIRHAAIALGSLYEYFRFRNVKSVKLQLDVDDFPLRHYFKAISMLVNSGAGEHATKISLIVCILFVSFEVSYPVSSEYPQLTLTAEYQRPLWPSLTTH